MPTVANTLTMTGTPLVATAATSLELRQTGDTYGTTKMSLLNRTGINGPLFENLGLDLVDFGMKPSSGLQCVIRNRHAGGISDSSNPAGQLEVQFDSLTSGGKTAWVFGEALSAMAGVLQFGTLSLGNPPANRDVGLTRNAAGVLEVNSGTAGTFRDLKCDEVNAVTGYQINGAAASNKILKANGTNFVASTETYDAPGTAGNVLVSDGTNWKAKIPFISNASAAASQTGFASDQYLTGSTITIGAGGWAIGTVYKCVFDMAKTGGTAGYVFSVRMGTVGSNSDAAVYTLTNGTSGTAVSDTGLFTVLVTFRAVGASAVIVVTFMLNRLNNTAVGFANVTNSNIVGTAASSSFNSTTQTKIGLSFNGGASFGGTCTTVQAELRQL